MSYWKSLVHLERKGVRYPETRIIMEIPEVTPNTSQRNSGRNCGRDPARKSKKTPKNSPAEILQISCKNLGRNS